MTNVEIRRKRDQIEDENEKEDEEETVIRMDYHGPYSDYTLLCKPG